MPPDYLRWAQSETLARLTVVLFGWVGSTTFLKRIIFGSAEKFTPKQKWGRRCPAGPIE
jgi:hypothetical protein